EAASVSPIIATSMRNELGSASAVDHGAIGTADFSQAKAVSVPGSTARVWIVPAGDKACIVIADPTGGYGGSCNSLADIVADRAIGALGPIPDRQSPQTVVAVIVPDGGTPPSVRSANGAEQTLSVDNNVAATEVAANSGASIEMPDQATSIPVAEF